MKKFFLLLCLAVTSLTVSAQSEQQPAELKFGVVSHDSVLRAMPEYVEAQKSLDMLREQYAAEQKRVEDDFNKKYEEFLDGQSTYPATILQKRQSELQEMLDKNIAFKKESQQLLQRAEAEALQPLYAKLSAAIAKVGTARQLAFIYNADEGGVSWLNPSLSEDVTEAVKAALSE